MQPFASKTAFILFFSLLTVFNVIAASLSRSTPAGSCHDYVLIEARGTDEPQGPSEGFKGMVKTVLSTISNGVEYDLPYPAIKDDAQKTTKEGGETMVKFIQESVRRCPEQTFVLLGLSQGATVVQYALNEVKSQADPLYEKIKAVVLLGNPQHRAGEVSTVDQNGGSSTKKFDGVLLHLNTTSVPALWDQSGKLLDVCYQNDLVCVGIRLFSLISLGVPHRLYGATASVQTLGAKFITQRI